MNPWGQKKWYARTCSVDKEGNPTFEHWAPTLPVLKSLVEADRPNYWVVWKEGEYQETWTTIWDYKRTLFCIHRSGPNTGVPSAKLTPEENEELEKMWHEDAEVNAEWKYDFDNECGIFAERLK